jgi:CRP/FNR family transcriptional regulator
LEKGRPATSIFPKDGWLAEHTAWQDPSFVDQTLRLRWAGGIPLEAASKKNRRDNSGPSLRDRKDRKRYGRQGPSGAGNSLKRGGVAVRQMVASSKSGMSTPRKDIHNSNVPKLCQSCEVRHKGMCGALNADELVDFAQFTRVVKVSAGDVLLQEQGPIASYANVMRGVFKLTKTMADGREQIVGLKFAPDFVGRLHQDESPVRVEACSDVEICSITRNALRKMLEENPALEAKLLHQALREVDQGREWMLALGRKTAHEKVASFLMMMVRQLDPLAGGDAATAFDLPLTRAEISDFLGLTIGTVSRELTRLRRAGVIRISSHRHVDILDLEALRQCAG